MQEFTKNDYIEYEDVEIDEIIKYENHYLIVKKSDSCKNCFFNEHDKYNCNIRANCIGRNGEEINFEELTEIEMLIILGEKNIKCDGKRFFVELDKLEEI